MCRHGNQREERGPEKYFGQVYTEKLVYMNTCINI